MTTRRLLRAALVALLVLVHYCGGLAGAATANGAAVRLGTCNGQSNQRWTLG